VATFHVLTRKTPLHGVLLHYRRGIFNSNASRVLISRHWTPINVQAAPIKLAVWRIYGKPEKSATLVIFAAQVTFFPLWISCEGLLPSEACLALASRNNGQFGADIAIRKKRSCIMGCGACKKYR
jgi:hypothetical protein